MKLNTKGVTNIYCRMNKARDAGYEVMRSLTLRVMRTAALTLLCSLQRRFWNQTLMTRAFRPVISTSCSCQREIRSAVILVVSCHLNVLRLREVVKWNNIFKILGSNLSILIKNLQLVYTVLSVAKHWKKTKLCWCENQKWFNPWTQQARP